VEKRHQPWVDDCTAQVTNALAAVDAAVDPAAPYLLLGRLTQADITAFVAERLARFGPASIPIRSSRTCGRSRASSPRNPPFARPAVTASYRPG